MAKHFIMGDGKLTDEERQQLEQQKIDREAKEKEWLEKQKLREKEEKQVTLSELLNTTLVPQEDRIVVWRDPSEKVTDAGIIIPEEVQKNKRPSRGTVIAVGTGKSNENLTQELLLALLESQPDEDVDQEEIDAFRKRIVSVTANYKPGDRIMFGRFAGTPIDDPETGEELLIMRPADIFVKM